MPVAKHLKTSLANVTDSKMMDWKCPTMNVRAVWRIMATWYGSAHLNETMGTLNSTSMSKRVFSKIEKEIGNMWASTLSEDLIANGRREKEIIAIEKGQFQQGINNLGLWLGLEQALP